MIRKADEILLEEIRTAYALLDPVPAPVVDAGKAALSWADPDAALAVLTEDSALAAGAVATRGEAGADTAANTGAAGPVPVSRLLSFAAGDLTLEVEASAEDGTRALAGRLDPAGPAEIKVRWDGGEVSCRTDDSGYFTAERVPPGLVSLELRMPDESTVVTSWVRV